jgi:hemolysin activation/secretion protein
LQPAADQKNHIQMALTTRHDKRRPGRFGNGPVLRLTLIAASLATLSPVIFAQTTSRTSTVQTARLFGNVGPEPSSEVPLTPSAAQESQPAPVERVRPPVAPQASYQAPAPAPEPATTPASPMRAAPVAPEPAPPTRPENAPARAAVVLASKPAETSPDVKPAASDPAVPQVRSARLFGNVGAEVVSATPSSALPVQAPVSAAPVAAVAVEPVRPAPAPVALAVQPAAVPAPVSLAPPTVVAAPASVALVAQAEGAPPQQQPPTALAAEPSDARPLKIARGLVNLPQPAPIAAPVGLPVAEPVVEPAPAPERSARLFGNVGGESPTPGARVIVAQAPGAGGAQVPAAPATPKVQPAPAPGPSPAPAAAPADSGGPRFEIRAFQVEGSTLIPTARFGPLLRPFLGPNKSFGDVQQALEVIERLFVSEGFGSVQVLLPEQDLEDGTIDFKVVEPRIARVVVEGNKEYSEANILASLPGVRPGEAPNSNVIAANLRLANENPGKATTVLLRAGSNDGEVDAVVKVTEDSVGKVSYSFDNTGTDVTGRGASGNYRHSIGGTYANFLGRDHVLAGQVITSPQENRDFRAGISKDVLVIGASYRIPFYESGNMLDISAGYSNVNSGAVQNIFTVSGRGSVFGIRWTQNLPRIGEYDHRLIYAFDFRAYGNSVVPVGGGTAIVPDITVKPISLTYSGTLRESSAETSGYISYNQNLPGGGNGGSGQWEAGTTATGTGARAGGRPGYTLIRYGFSHYRAFANDWQARFNLAGQATKDRLIAPEQFGLGGANSIRGFVERQFANDWGSYANFEVYTPDVAPLLKFGNETKMRVVVFHDYGHLVRNGPQASETERVSASSGGFGFRIAQGSNLSIKLDAAWANRPAHTGDTDRPTVTRNFRMHGSLLYIF